MNPKWFGVRCLFRHGGGGYEERITVWPASSLEEAIEKAEGEAREYVDGLDCKYLGLAQAFGPAMTPDVEEARDLVAGCEVFSLIRHSSLSPDDYIDRFFETGDEYQEAVDDDDQT